MATSGDLRTATSGDFLMATDTQMVKLDCIGRHEGIAATVRKVRGSSGLVGAGHPG